MKNSLLQTEYFMQIALELAKKGEEKTFPNPNVGAVIIKDEKIIGKGYHRFFGDAHAEIHALKEAGEKSKDAILYVTLEPCSHYGKTPPCVDAIIKSRIKKVYVGIKDPNPLVRGKGIEILKKNGIEVQTGILKSELEKFYSVYSNRFKKRKSHIVLKYAMTLDGKIATEAGDSKWISSLNSRSWVHKLRTEYDGIMVGVNTIIKDDPSLTSHKKGKNPVRIIVDGSLRIPINAKVLNDQLPTVVIYSNSSNNEKIKSIREKGKYLIQIKSNSNAINFKKIIEELNRISIFSVLIEGGGTTAWNALKDKVVDEIITFVSPKIIGGKNAITPVEGEGYKMISKGIKIKFEKFEKIGNDILIISKVLK